MNPSLDVLSLVSKKRGKISGVDSTNASGQVLVVQSKEKSWDVNKKKKKMRFTSRKIK